MIYFVGEGCVKRYAILLRFEYAFILSALLCRHANSLAVDSFVSHEISDEVEHVLKGLHTALFVLFLNKLVFFIPWPSYYSCRHVLSTSCIKKNVRKESRLKV